MLPWPAWLCRLGIVLCTERLPVQFLGRHMLGLWLIDASLSLSLKIKFKKYLKFFHDVI